jgi:hypothetical protein
MKLGLYMLPYTKINSKWLKDLHLSLQSMKPLKKNKGRNLHDIGLDNEFLVLQIMGEM